MPILPTKSFSTMVSDVVVGIQGRSSKLVNFAIGSTLRAIAEGFSGLFLWYQALVLKLLTAIRLSTSTGSDVDSFTADFMPVVAGTTSPRLGAQAASGLVTFGRFTAGPSAPFIPVGTTVRSNDGSQEFKVTANTLFSSYSAALDGYTLPVEVATIDVPVESTNPGLGGNVQAGAISVMTSPVVGIDYVNNNANFTNGADQESDSALKSRFSAYILGLARGDIYGLAAAIARTGVNIQWTLVENYNFDGTVRYGYFFVVADDGSGSPSPDFLSGVLEAVNSVRPLGIQCQVFPPTIVVANVSMQITVATGYNHNSVVAAVIANVTKRINDLGLGVSLSYSILSSWAYEVAGVKTVTAIILNGGTGDPASISATRATVDGYSFIADRTIKAGTITVS